MPLHPLTYTRDAATGPTLTGGRAEGAVNLKGGINEWKEAGKEIVK